MYDIRQTCLVGPLNKILWLNCEPGTCKIDFTAHVCGGPPWCCRLLLLPSAGCWLLHCRDLHVHLYLTTFKKITSHCFSEGIVTRFDGHALAGIFGTWLNKIVVAILTARCGDFQERVILAQSGIFILYKNRRYITSVHKNPPLDPILCQLYSVYSVPTCFFINYLNIILYS
jgi:hypothetical protein